MIWQIGGYVNTHASVAGGDRDNPMASLRREEGLDFTVDQRRAIAHTKGSLQIVACPGSGKTEVVSQRVATLIESGAEPSSIAAFTFTENAANELKARIRRILEVRCPERADFGDMFVGTIHSYCYHTIRELDPRFRSFDVLDDAKRTAYLSMAYNRIGLIRLQKALGLRKYQVIRRFVPSADIVTDEMIPPKKLRDRRFRECYLAYREALTDDRYFDFSTSIAELVELSLRSPALRARLREKVRHVIVDEFQDINQIQDRLISLLSEGGESLCVVGDDDQNIFHWRGSDVGIIREFAKRFRKRGKYHQVRLQVNFRSTKAVIETASSLIARNARRLPKKMVPNPELRRPSEDGDIVLKQFPTDNDELKFISSKIRELRGSEFLGRDNAPFSLSYSDFAVIVRRNDDAARVVRYLDSLPEKIPAVASSGEGIFHRPEVQLALDCIGYCFDCGQWRDGAADIPDLARLKASYSAVFDPTAFPKADPRRFAVKMKALRVETTALLAKPKKKDYLPELGLLGIFHRVLSSMGAEEFDLGDVPHYNLAALSSAIADYESVWIRLRASQVPYFFGYVQAFAGNHYTESSHEEQSVIDAVRVMTIHKAKGLEFPVVFMPYFVRRNKHRTADLFLSGDDYPSARYMGDEEDDRRMYYTAMTRTEKYLFITGAERLEGLKKAYSMHPFAEELDGAHISEKLSTPKPKSEHLQRARLERVFPTSYSDLDCFNRCPQDFRFRHVMEYNAGVPVTFGFGTNVHNALSQVHTDYIRERRIPTEGELDALVDRMFKVRYAPPAIAENMKAGVKRIVKNYVDKHKDDFDKVLETEKRFEFVEGRSLIAGQIDLLKKVRADGRPVEVEIIDFKTDRNDGVYKENYAEQLRFYAIACLEALGLRPTAARVHHLDTDTFDTVDISEPQLTHTREEIKGRVENILSRKFVATPSPSLCIGCDFRRLCPHKGFATLESSGKRGTPRYARRGHRVSTTP